MRKERKHFTPEEKVAILRRHLVDRAPVGPSAGILSSLPKNRGIEGLLREAIRKRAAQAFLAVAERVEAAGIPPMSEEEIQREVNAVRKAKRQARARRR